MWLKSMGDLQYPRGLYGGHATVSKMALATQLKQLNIIPHLIMQMTRQRALNKLAFSTPLLSVPIKIKRISSPL